MSFKCSKCGHQNTPGATASNQQSSIATFTMFQSECLEAHNFYRDRHGVQRLKLSKSLCSFSQDWADTLVRKGRMEHRTNLKYGENIYSAWSSDPNHVVNGKKPVDSWYSEVNDYTFGREPSSMKTGHFSQVVWRNCSELGVGVARDSRGNVYVVCNYNPPGNYVGDYRNNVPPPM